MWSCKRCACSSHGACIRALALAATLVLMCAPAAKAAAAAATPSGASAAQQARKVAIASQRRAVVPSGSGKAQALAAGVPIDVDFLAAHPEAANAPLAAPDLAAANAAKYPTNGVTTRPKVAPAVAQSQARLAAAAAIGSGASSIVKTSGTNFVLNGKVVRPSGTSWYDLLKMESYQPADIVAQATAHAQNGVRVLRAWGHVNGYGTSESTRNPIQPTPGVFNETVLQRYDFVMDTMSKAGLRMIWTMVNFWDNFGGAQWYVDNIIGKGQPLELFYTDTRTRAAYKAWLAKIVNRVNTVNGRKYSEDPTIFSWELCNECHTTDNYEIDQKLPAGQIVYNWQVEMSQYLKNTLKVKQMASNGNEGYRAKGAYDPNASLSFPYSNWLNSGLKGEDFNRNLGISTLDFGTIHAYPSNFDIVNTAFEWINPNYICDRNTLAKAANKPLMLQEFGQPANYLAPRDIMFSSMLAAAGQCGVAATMAWEAWVSLRWSSASYDFQYSDPGGPTMLKEYAYRLGAGPSPAPYAAPPPPPLAETCSKGFYRAVGQCRACVSSTKPFTKKYGGTQCVQPTTISAQSTACSNLVLPASIMGSSPANLVSCINADAAGPVTLFLPVKSSIAPFLNGSKTYVKTSLRLASTIPPRTYTNGGVVYKTVAIGAAGNQRVQFQFTDQFRVLKKSKGKNVQITGVLDRGGTLLDQCFSSILKVCA